jgi:hypothetical protein
MSTATDRFPATAWALFHWARAKGRCTMSDLGKPTRWTFDLDPRATSMSLTSTAERFEPVFATPETVELVVGTFENSANTPPEVVQLLGMSRKLLATCVIHYEFAAVAAEKSLQGLELAVRHRLGAGTGPSFASLIQRLKASGDYTDEEIDMLDTGRIVRNRVFAHPTGAVALPLVMMTDVIRTSHRLIARLFPDS